MDSDSDLFLSMDPDLSFEEILQQLQSRNTIISLKLKVHYLNLFLKEGGSQLTSNQVWETRMNIITTEIDLLQLQLVPLYHEWTTTGSNQARLQLMDTHYASYLKHCEKSDLAAMQPPPSDSDTDEAIDIDLEPQTEEEFQVFQNTEDELDDTPSAEDDSGLAIDIHTAVLDEIPISHSNLNSDAAITELLQEIHPSVSAHNMFDEFPTSRNENIEVTESVIDDEDTFVKDRGRGFDLSLIVYPIEHGCSARVLPGEGNEPVLEELWHHTVEISSPTPFGKVKEVVKLELNDDDVEAPSAQVICWDVFRPSSFINDRGRDDLLDGVLGYDVLEVGWPELAEPENLPFSVGVIGPLRLPVAISCQAKDIEDSGINMDVTVPNYHEGTLRFALVYFSDIFLWWYVVGILPSMLPNVRVNLLGNIVIRRFDQLPFNHILDEGMYVAMVWKKRVMDGFFDVYNLFGGAILCSIAGSIHAISRSIIQLQILELPIHCTWLLMRDLDVSLSNLKFGLQEEVKLPEILDAIISVRIEVSSEDIVLAVDEIFYEKKHVITIAFPWLHCGVVTAEHAWYWDPGISGGWIKVCAMSSSMFWGVPLSVPLKCVSSKFESKLEKLGNKEIAYKILQVYNLGDKFLVNAISPILFNSEMQNSAPSLASFMPICEGCSLLSHKLELSITNLLFMAEHGPLYDSLSSVNILLKLQTKGVELCSKVAERVGIGPRINALHFVTSQADVVGVISRPVADQLLKKRDEIFYRHCLVFLENLLAAEQFNEYGSNNYICIRYSLAGSCGDQLGDLLQDQYHQTVAVNILDAPPNHDTVFSTVAENMDNELIHSFQFQVDSFFVQQFILETGDVTTLEQAYVFDRGRNDSQLHALFELVPRDTVMKTHQILESFCNAFLRTVIRIPFEVLKLTLQAGLFDIVGEAIVGTWLKDGIRGFFHGIGATLFREVPLYVAGMGIYAESKKATQQFFGIDLEPWETSIWIVLELNFDGIHCNLAAAALVLTVVDLLVRCDMSEPGNIILVAASVSLHPTMSNILVFDPGGNSLLACAIKVFYDWFGKLQRPSLEDKTLSGEGYCHVPEETTTWHLGWTKSGIG